MKRLFLCISVALCAPLAYSQSEPTVVVDNLAITHEHKGWRVVEASTTPIHFNLMKGDLIVRIDGRNAGDTGPMIMASLLNAGTSWAIHLFIERGSLRMETKLREISTLAYDPGHADPFKHVAPGFSAPDAEFKDIDGQPLTLEQYRDKWLLIDFMGTWCQPCTEILPELLTVADRKQLSLLMVPLRDKAEAVRRMQQNYQLHSPIAMMQPMAQMPVDFGITTNLWTGQIPAFVLIRPDGEVALIAIGVSDTKQIEKTIESSMSRKADEASK